MDRIKRPLTAFFCFVKNIREGLQSDNPELSNKDIFKILMQRWKEMNDEEKSIYLEMARVEKQRYDQEIGIRNNILRDTQKNEDTEDAI